MNNINNINNITTLINNQIVMMNTYNNNVSQSMQHISSSIRELIHLQEARDMEESLIRRRYGFTPPSHSASREYTDYNINRINENINRLNRNRREPSTRRESSTRREPPIRNNPFFFSSTRLPSTRRSRNRSRQSQTRQPLASPLFSRRRVTLQEFINSTLNQGNVRIPASRNQIMQETSIITYDDLTEADTDTCPISLVAFDSSSNILRINQCNHVFEASSLMRWFQEDSRCPVCRYNINIDRDNIRDISSQSIRQSANLNENRSVENRSVEYRSINIPENTVVYDISFSIPQLFGRDMSENQINSVIDSITNTITNSMNNSLSNYSQSLGNGEVVVEEMIIEQVDNNNDLNSSFQSMEDDSDEN